jgi:hypothetical protein
MRVRGHHHHAVAKLRQLDVVDIAAAAGDKSRIFDPGNGLTETEFVHNDLLIIFSRRPEARATCAPRRTAAEALEMSPFEAHVRSHLRVTE